MAKSIKTDLNIYLKDLNKTDLEKEVKKLYSKFDDVKKYYELELSPDTSGVLKEYKEKIRKIYQTNRAFQSGTNRASRKVVSDFKKISIFKQDVIELLLYRVEIMIWFTNQYGDIDEPFYNSLESSFLEACKLIRQEHLLAEYKEYCRGLMNETRHFGWGVYDGFEQIFDEYLA